MGGGGGALIFLKNPRSEHRFTLSMAHKGCLGEIPEQRDETCKSFDAQICDISGYDAIFC